MPKTEGSEKRRSNSPVIDEKTVKERAEEEYEDDLIALLKMPPEEQPGSWKTLCRKQTLERRRVEAKYKALRDITRDLQSTVIQLESSNDVLRAKLHVRPSLEELERMVIPAWLLNSELSYKTMWIVSIKFKLTPNAAILSKRIEDSKNLTTDILAEAMIKLYNNTSRKISHNDDPEGIVLAETEWKVSFRDVEILNNLQQQAVKLALKPVVKCETNLEKETLDQGNENFVVYISDIGNSFNLKRYGEKNVAKKIVEICDIMVFTKHCKEYYFPRSQGGEYTFETFLVVVNISATTIETWEKNLAQVLPIDSTVRSEKAVLF